MPSSVRYKILEKLLTENGWILARINGSHHIFSKPGAPNIVIPVHKGKVLHVYLRNAKKIIAEQQGD